MRSLEPSAIESAGATPRPVSRRARVAGVGGGHSAHCAMDSARCAQQWTWRVALQAGRRMTEATIAAHRAGPGHPPPSARPRWRPMRVQPSAPAAWPLPWPSASAAGKLIAGQLGLPSPPPASAGDPPGCPRLVGERDRHPPLRTRRQTASTRSGTRRSRLAIAAQALLTGGSRHLPARRGHAAPALARAAPPRRHRSVTTMIAATVVTAALVLHLRARREAHRVASMKVKPTRSTTAPHRRQPRCPGRHRGRVCERIQRLDVGLARRRGVRSSGRAPAADGRGPAGHRSPERAPRRHRLRAPPARGSAEDRGFPRAQDTHGRAHLVPRDPHRAARRHAAPRGTRARGPGLGRDRPYRSRRACAGARRRRARRAGGARRVRAPARTAQRRCTR